jgi:hypothetical protein
MIRFGSAWVWLFGATALGCASDPWRGCTLCQQSSRLPGLQRQADPGPPALASAPHCAKVATSGLADEPETVDDLDALLDRGRVCGPDGHADAVHVCPPLTTHGYKLVAGPAASGVTPTCGAGAAACPNQSLTIQKQGADPIVLEFYDDPSSHRAAALATCADGAKLGTCYYRLGGLSQALRL